MEPKVSVIIPVYNVERYIYRCVDSIINQTYKNLEIILVNDGSTDQSSKICDQYSISDKRIKVIHKENGGLSNARNAGLEIYTGNYVMFVDSDDYVEWDLVEKAVEKIVKNKSDVVIWGYYTDYVDLNEKHLSTRENRGLHGSYTKNNFNKIPVTNRLLRVVGYAWNKLYKADMIKINNYTFTNGLSLVEDIVFNGPLLEECNVISFIEDPLVHYMQRPRETLGAKFYDNYFELKKLSMEAVRNILISWGKKEDEVDRIVGQIGFNALKSTVRSLSQANNYSNYEKEEYLDKLFNDEIAKKVLTNVKLSSLKDKLIKHFMLVKNKKIILKIYEKK